MTLKLDTLLINQPLFDKVKKRFEAPKSIVSDYNISTKIVFSELVLSWYDEVTDNLIENFFKRHKYRTILGLKCIRNNYSSTTTLCRTKA